jgi:O-antigen/teichoic acid export membrane protein
MSESFPLQQSANEDRGAKQLLLTRFAVRVLNSIPGLRGTSLSDRLLVAVHGSMWTVAGYGMSQVLKLVSTLVLARLLLDPKAFGLMALVNVFLGGLEVITDIGLGMDIVQHPRGEEPLFLDTAFLFQLLRSVLLSLIAVALAVPFASFYHQPEVRWLAIAGSLSIAVRGFSSMSVWVLTRRVRLGQIAGINVIGDAAGLVVSVVWALLSPTAWALVGGRIATALAYVVASHFLSDRLPRLRWDTKAARDILMFGSGLFLSSATYFFSSETDRLIVGKFATVAELGCFSLALSMSYPPLGIMQRIISNVFFPMISNATREDPAVAARQFRKFRLVFLIASAVIAAGYICLSNLVVHFVLRPQYAATAWMLQLLGFRSALELFGSAASSMLFAVGITRYAAIGNTAKLLFIALGLTIAFSRFGLREAILVLALSPFVYYAAMLWGLRKNVRFVFWTELLTLAGFVAITAVILVAYHLVSS